MLFPRRKLEKKQPLLSRNPCSGKGFYAKQRSWVRHVTALECVAKPQPQDPVKVVKASHELGGREFIQNLNLLLRRRGQRLFRLGDDFKQMPIGLVGDLDRNGLGVISRDIFFGQPREQAVKRAMLGVRGNALDQGLPERLVSLQPVMLLRQPVVELAHGAFPFEARRKRLSISRIWRASNKI